MEQLRRHIETITPLTDEEFNYISSFFSVRTIRRGQFLIQDGDPVRNEFWIMRGLCKVYHIGVDGREHIVQFGQPTEWISDYHAYFRQVPAALFVECIKEGAVLCLSLFGREKLASELHKMEHFFRVKLTDSYMQLEKRVTMLLAANAQQRYDDFTRLYPDLTQQISKKCIAEYLGVSRETLSRL